MKRVLQVFARLTRGGLETFVMNVYRTINREEIQFDFLVCADGGDYEEEVKRMGGRIFKIAPRNSGLLNYYSSLDAFFKTHQGEWIAIHQHVSSLSSIEPQYYAKKYGIPVRVLHSHSSSIASSVKMNSLHKMFHYISKLFVKSWCTDYLGCSDKAIDWLYSGTGVRGKALMINNGIELERYRYSLEIREKVRCEFGIETNTVIVGHVGSFIKVKNHAFLLKVFQAFRQLHSNTKLLLVGDGPLRDSIEEQAKNIGIDDLVIFAGIRSDVNELLQAMDIFVMPSLFEGLPVSLVEAQSTGLPVFASDTISHDAKLTDEFYFISLGRTPEEWAQNIANCLSNYIRTDKTLTISEKGFDIKGISNKLMSIYTHKNNKV